MRLQRLSVVIASSAVLLAWCVGGPAGSADRPVVVATTTQLGDIVQQVAGRRAVVPQILQANTDPHECEPRAGDVAATAGAGLVVESGNGLDGWMGRVVEQAGGHPAVLRIAPAHTPDRIAGGVVGAGGVAV
jgi:ABC-type Zn uptake system ZnuABC Zn-binding protein ZnuA